MTILDMRELPEATEPVRTRLLRTHQVSEIYGVPAAQLEVLRHRGGGPAFAKLGRAVYYRAEDIEAWIAASMRTSTSDPGLTAFPRHRRARKDEPAVRHDCSSEPDDSEPDEETDPIKPQPSDFTRAEATPGPDAGHG